MDRSGQARRAAVPCWIYKGTRRDGVYLYLPEPHDTARVPDELVAAMGRLELVLELTLTPERRLARADAGEVIRALETRGYYLQLPPVDMPDEPRIQ